MVTEAQKYSRNKTYQITWLGGAHEEEIVYNPYVKLGLYSIYNTVRDSVFNLLSPG
jgi:hypothetical protein